jgi:integrase
MDIRTKGTGSIFKRSKNGVELPNYYLGFYDRNGRQIQESSGSPIKAVAERKLRKRLEEVERGVPVEQSRRLKYGDIRQSLLTDYANNKVGLATRRKQIYGLTYLDEFFGNMLVANITTARLRECQAKLLSGELQKIVYRKTKCTDKRAIHGASAATCNRIFALLRRAMNIARIDGLIQAVPHFPMLAENNVRTGFIEAADFRALLTDLPVHLRPLMVFLYTTGCRVGAATQILWTMVSKDARTITLPGRLVKNKKPITIPLTRELTDVLKKQFRNDGPLFDATNLRGAWDAATVAAGFPDLIVHDLRRSGARNLVNGGTPETVAMEIGGWRTRSVFIRYNIVAPKQKEQAMELLQQANGNLMGASNG